MRPHIAELAAKAPFMMSAHANAKLTDESGHYAQTPEMMGGILEKKPVKEPPEYCSADAAARLRRI
ncbi:MAG: hypothetical protein V8T87_06235 [Victivallales bacterium]